MSVKARVFVMMAGLAVTALVPSAVGAADAGMGAELAVQCAACHGEAGVSTNDKYPNLAAQKQAYLVNQLRAFRAGTRKNPLMNAIAEALSDDDIDNLAAHFARLKGAEPSVVSANTSGLDGSAMTFPTDYKTTFTRYHRKDFDDRKQVRYFSGNAAAVEAVRSGGPFPSGAFLLVEIFAAEQDADGNLKKDADGKLIEGKLAAFTAMEKRGGWGDAVPEIYKNGDWRYAVFKADGTNRIGINEAECMACHKPLDEADYSFTLDWIKDFASSGTLGYSHNAVK